jgi:hypothetical protein
MLHGAGDIELPATRQTSSIRLGKETSSQPVLIETSAHHGRLTAIRPISLQEVRRAAFQ